MAGNILCRLDMSSRFGASHDSIRNLGTFFQKHCIGSFKPYFLICEQGTEVEGTEVTITQPILEVMTKNASFDLGPITITVPNANTIVEISLYLDARQKLPISGFPRALFAQSITESM